ncbi:MAG TPA: hypothetical protein VEA19_08170 [Actinomycetota bacterium]|nr:hypothetical protein [Actinomycetota bacterium]
MQSVARLVAASLVATSVALGAPSAAGGQTSGAKAEIGDVLDVRARAMLSGDREGFLATVAPDQPEFRRRQIRLFDGFQRLGLESYSLDATDRFWPELTTARERSRYPSEAVVLHVEERYAIRGYDRQPALEDLYLTFVRGPGGWVIASDQDLSDLALYSGRKLWENGPIRVARSEHFLFVSHPDLAPAARRVLRAAERALRRVQGRWPLPWHQRVLILAPSTEDELQRLIQASFDLDVFVAFAASGVDRARDWQLAGHRILLNWPNFSAYPEETSEEILVHELLHIATRDDAGPMIPIYVEEGVAEWVTGERPGGLLQTAVRSGRFDERLPDDHEFVSGSDREIVTAYAESTAAAVFAVERFGRERVASFYDVLGEIRRAPGIADHHVDAVMQDVFGLTAGTFEEEWARWTRRTLR